MQTVAVSEFRAHLVRFLDKVESGETIVLTSRGKEIARVMPPEYARETARRTLATIRSDVEIGDVISPIAAEWKVR
jgi:prevent-host-death family protein